MSMNISQRFPTFAPTTGLGDLAWGKNAQPQSAAKPATAAPSQDAGVVVDANAQAKASIQQTFKDQFGALAANKDEFHAKMKLIYGDGYDAGKAEQFRQKALAGDYSWLPPIRFASSEDLKGGNGCYVADEGVVYLNADLKDDPAMLGRVYVEEAGHHLDTQLNTTDAAGDEGELFRRVLSGEQLSRSTVDAIKNENDHATITINGKKQEVEFWFGEDLWNGAKKVVSGAVDGVKKAGEAVVNGVKKGAEAVGNAIGTAAKAVGKTAGNVFGGVFNGIKAFGEGVFGAVKTFGEGIGEGVGGFFSNIVKGKVGEAFKSVIRGADKAIFQSTQRLANGIIDGAESILDGATHLLGPLGDPARSLLHRGVDMVRQFWNTSFQVARDAFRLLPETALTLGDGLVTAGGLLFQGKFGKAAEAFGMAFANAGARFAGGIVDIGATVLQGLADIAQKGLFLAPPSRKPTADEIALLKEVYGDNIDYDAVRINVGGPLGADINGRARVVGSTVYLPKDFGNEQLFDTDAMGNRKLTKYGETLIHEFGHVWQNQNGGGDYVHKALWGQIAGDGYDFQKAINEGKSFAQMNPEQQADYISEFLAPVLAQSGDIDANINASSWTDAQKAYARDALEHLRKGDGTPGDLWPQAA